MLTLQQLVKNDTQAASSPDLRYFASHVCGTCAYLIFTTLVLVPVLQFAAASGWPGTARLAAAHIG